MDDFWHHLHVHNDSSITVEEFIDECFGQAHVAEDDANEVRPPLTWPIRRSYPSRHSH